MEIREVKENKKEYLHLLLLADEEEIMIDKYLNRGSMFVIDDDGVKCECVVTDEGDGVLEIKNIATLSNFQGKGYGKKMIAFLEEKYKGKFSILKVGTGDSLLTIPFYEKCGFVVYDKIENFFIDNYSHPIYECGKRLIDMIYLKKEI